MQKQLRPGLVPQALSSKMRIAGITPFFRQKFTLMAQDFIQHKIILYAHKVVKSKISGYIEKWAEARMENLFDCNFSFDVC